MKLQWSGRSGDEVSWLFMQVIIEVAVSLILCLWAALIVPGTFLPILPDSKENRFVYLVLNGHNLLYINIHTYIHTLNNFASSMSNAVECVENWTANLISFSFLG
jgi:hypothetical protein